MLPAPPIVAGRPPSTMPMRWPPASMLGRSPTIARVRRWSPAPAGTTLMEAATPRITDPTHGRDVARGLVCNERVRADGQRRCWCSCPSEHECACYDAARKQSFHGKPLYGSVALTQRVARGPEWRLNGAWLGPEQRYNAPASNVWHVVLPRGDHHSSHPAQRENAKSGYLDDLHGVLLLFLEQQQTSCLQILLQ